MNMTIDEMRAFKRIALTSLSTYLSRPYNPSDRCRFRASPSRAKTRRLLWAASGNPSDFSIEGFYLPRDFFSHFLNVLVLGAHQKPNLTACFLLLEHGRVACEHIPDGRTDEAEISSSEGLLTRRLRWKPRSGDIRYGLRNGAYDLLL